MKSGVTAVIPTKDRYKSTLPLAITSVANQTYRVRKIIVVDDSPNPVNLSQDSLYRYIFRMLQHKKIDIWIEFGIHRGQSFSHQRGMELAETEWIWRLDDDNVAEPDCLENLIKAAEDDPDIAACGGLVLDPTNLLPWLPVIASNKIEDWALSLNVQWFRKGHKGIMDVDHIYSSFIYRKILGLEVGFPADLSPVSHTEETQFSYGLKRNGWRVIIQPEAVTWHYRCPEGGIRSYSDGSLWAQDSMKINNKLKQWGVELNKYQFIVLDNGLGDHICFRSILPEIREKYPGHIIVISCCYPEVFEDDKDIRIITIADAQIMGKRMDDYNLYKFMWDRNWKRSLADAFREMYIK